MLKDSSACAVERLTRDSWGNEFLSFVLSITMRQCRTMLGVSQKPESEDGVCIFGLCFVLFLHHSTQNIDFYFFLHFFGRDYFVEKVIFVCRNTPVCPKEIWICTLRVLRIVLG